MKVKQNILEATLFFSICSEVNSTCYSPSSYAWIAPFTCVVYKSYFTHTSVYYFVIVSEVAQSLKNLQDNHILRIETNIYKYKSFL